MIPGWLGWGLAAFALGFTVSCLILPLIGRRHPGVLYPLDWLRGRRLRRKMSDPADRNQA